MGERRSLKAKIWLDKGKENRKIKRELVENRGKRKETRERERCDVDEKKEEKNRTKFSYRIGCSLRLQTHSIK